MSKLSEETSDSLRAMKEKQTSLGVALSGVQAEVAIMTVDDKHSSNKILSVRAGDELDVQIFPKLTLPT